MEAAAHEGGKMTMRFAGKAGFGFWLACAPLLTAGCAGVSPKFSALPKAAHQQAEVRQYHQALQAERQGQLEQARDLYAALQRQSPRTPVYAQRMAVVSTQVGDHATAKKYFDHARRLDPNNAAVLTDMGYSAILQKDYPQAESLLREAVRLKPDDPRAVNNLGVALAHQGRDAESLALFRRVNSESQSLANLAYVHAQRGDHDKAVEGYRRAVDLDPTNKSAATALAQLSLPPEPASATPRLVAALPNSNSDVVPAPNKFEEREQPPRRVSEFETPVVRQSAVKTKADRPRDRLSDDEPPYFEDEAAPHRPVIASGTGMNRSSEGDFEKPLIVPFDAAEPVDQSVTPVANVQDEAAPREVAENAWALDEEPLLRPLPPQALVEDNPPDSFEEEPDELAGVFAEDDNSPEHPSPTAEAELEELTGLEWAAEDQAALAAAGSSSSNEEAVLGTDGFKGFCPVAIRDERRLIPALDQYACEFQSQTYRFHSAEALAAFQASPETYAPVAGGLDVVAVRGGEAVSNGTLDHAVWYRHRLHLFSTPENLAAFRAAPRSFGSVP